MNNEFKLENTVVEVVFKFDIEVVCVFNIPNIVVLVAFKLLIYNVDAVDTEFKLLNIVVNVAVQFLLIMLMLLIPNLN